jgi:2-polyprenyl-3-methyl-5-hydroxy-6-metoxy-1,4-benzoquinol methylase
MPTKQSKLLMVKPLIREEDMNKQFVDLLRCPITGQKLRPVLTHNDQRSASAKAVDQKEYHSTYLETIDGVHQYPIINDIPRFVTGENYASNFGVQWNKFAKTQLDSFSGLPITENRFFAATGWNKSELKGKWILDVGCGAGRFAEIAASSGANIIALDYSSAVDACRKNLKEYKNVHVIQGDIYCLPLAFEAFDYIYCLGVLQHTPNVKLAFESLDPHLKPGGLMCVDYYLKRFRSMMNYKYLLRPITKRMDAARLFNILEATTPVMLKVSQLLNKLPIVGKPLSRFVPVKNYTGLWGLSASQLLIWALLDTFDNLAPAYDNPQRPKTVKQWMNGLGYKNILVFHSSHLVARGQKKNFSE